jgi:hypothetical protein
MPPATVGTVWGGRAGDEGEMSTHGSTVARVTEGHVLQAFSHPLRHAIDGFGEKQKKDTCQSGAPALKGASCVGRERFCPV